MVEKKKILISLDKIIINSKELLLEELKDNFEEIRYFYGSEKLSKDRTLYDKILREFSRKGFYKNYFKELLKKENLKYYNKILKNYLDIDYVLMIGGLYYSKEFIELIKEKNSKIKFIVFLWDKFSKEEITKIKEIYDKVYTFEKSDALENNIKWRPSFYIKKEKNIEKTLDFYFLGENRDKERYEYINSLYKFCKKNGLKNKVYLYSKKKVKNLNNEIIIYNKISYEENLENIKRSKVTFEKNIEKQLGLSLRSLECLGYETKLITTNKDIKNYDFYSPNNIFIIENINEVNKIPLDFFIKQYEKIDDKILEKYSFKGFVKEILQTLEENR